MGSNLIISEIDGIVTCADNKGRTFIISSEDKWILQWYWGVYNGGATSAGNYVFRMYRESGKKVKVSMHRVLLSATDRQIVDHINGVTTDNTRDNLRICAHRENMANRKKSKNKSSQYKGVYWCKTHKMWRAHCRTKHIPGKYNTEEEAAIAYDKKAKELFGEFAKLNFPSF